MHIKQIYFLPNVCVDSTAVSIMFLSQLSSKAGGCNTWLKSQMWLGRESNMAFFKKKRKKMTPSN